MGELGGAPRVTEARLRQALKSGGENRFGNVLTPPVREQLEGTLEAVRAAGFPTQLKTTGTSGGGIEHRHGRDERRQALRGAG